MDMSGLARDRGLRVWREPNPSKAGINCPIA